MTALIRRLGVTVVALSFALSSLPSPAWADDDADTAHALALLGKGCGTPVAQVTPSAEPVASPSPSAIADASRRTSARQPPPAGRRS